MKTLCIMQMLSKLLSLLQQNIVRIKSVDIGVKLKHTDPASPIFGIFLLHLFATKIFLLDFWLVENSVYLISVFFMCKFRDQVIET